MERFWEKMEMKLRGFWIFVLSLISISTVACSNPFKVTDPADPNFKPENFRFEDYHGRERVSAVLKKLFPVGTPKEFVEKVLVDSGGAYEDSHGNEVNYVYEPDHLIPSFPRRVWNIGVQYDADNKLTLIKLNGTTIDKSANYKEPK